VTAAVESAEAAIRRLGLAPHPEGGWFRETFRDRGLSTAIYYLLQAGEVSHWHRVDAAEVWHWYAGATLVLSIADGDQTGTILLGPGIAMGERPQAIVPADAWQTAETKGDWTLCGCTVAPGFEFKGFELAPKNWTPAE